MRTVRTLDPSVVHCAVLFALGLAAWSNLFGGSYCFDDIPTIRDCRAIESAGNLSALVSDKYSVYFRELSYRPVVTLSYFVDGLIFGKRPGLSRLFDVALHVGAALLLYALWWRLFASRRIALFASALFLVHPIVTETVNSPGFREEILCLLFMLGAMHAGLRSLGGLDGRPSRRWAWLAAGLWLLSMLSKEPGVMMPALLLLAVARSVAWRSVAHLGWQVHRRRLLWASLPFVLAFVAFVLLYTSLSFQSFGGQGAGEASVVEHRLNPAAGWPGERSFPLRFFEFTRVCVLYARLWLLPVGLSVNHWFEPASGFGDWRLWAGFFAFVFFAGACAWLWRRGGDSAGLGGAWALVMLAPLMQIIPTPELVAERYMYLPHVGFSLLAASLVFRAGEMRAMDFFGSGMRRFVLVVALIVLAGLTWRRNRDWVDDVTLNLRAYEQWGNAEGWLARGALLYGMRDLRGALDCFGMAVEMDARLADGWRNLGLVYLEMGNLNAARYSLLTAEKLEPGDARTVQAMGILTAEEEKRAGGATSGTLRSVR